MRYPRTIPTCASPTLRRSATTRRFMPRTMTSRNRMRRRRPQLPRLGVSGSASLASIAAIRWAELHFRARAILRIRGSVGMCSPRSILPMCDRSIPARWASVSCAIPWSVLSSRTTAPNAIAGSASYVVVPAGRPRWIDRFCIAKSVDQGHDINHVKLNSFD